IMLLTSAVGGVLMIYSCLCLLDGLGKLDMLAVAQQKAPMLNYVCAGTVAVGLVLQFVLERLRARFGSKDGGDKSAKPASPAPKKSILQWGLDQLRKAA